MHTFSRVLTQIAKKKQLEDKNTIFIHLNIHFFYFYFLKKSLKEHTLRNRNILEEEQLNFHFFSEALSIPDNCSIYPKYAKSQTTMIG